MARWIVDRLPEQGLPSVSLRRLLPEARFTGETDWKVFGCANDHRRLEPGQVFVASRDSRSGYDGHHFVKQALERGAAGVVVERPCPEAGRLQVLVPNTTAAHARICHALAGDPSHQLMTIGVSGAFGKTIAASMVQSIFNAAGDRCGLISSSGFCDGIATHTMGAGFYPQNSRRDLGALPRDGREIGAYSDSHRGAFVPSASSLASLLARIVDERCKQVVVDVSAEALAQHSFEGIAFHAAIVTDVAAQRGLPPEITWEKRRLAAKLCRQVAPGGTVIVNADDPNSEMLGGLNLDARRVAFALEAKPPARRMIDVTARLNRVDSSGTRMVLFGFSRELTVHLPMVGPRIVTSALAAAALAWAMEIPEADVVAGLEAVQSPAGHLESVVAGQDFDVRVDCAQTPEEMADALTALRALAGGRIHLVLSAEGNTDRLERRRLAQISEASADRVILTLSNPRAEDPNQIIDDLLSGFQRPGKVCVEPDRRIAIQSALSHARTGDVVLIAGKGHRTYQIFADSVTPFDDYAVAREWLRSNQKVVALRSA